MEQMENVTQNMEETQNNEIVTEPRETFMCIWQNSDDLTARQIVGYFYSLRELDIGVSLEYLDLFTQMFNKSLTGEKKG